MFPKVSIIVLNWNGKTYLEDCLLSLQHTAYPNLEIMVVDNASTDGSEEIVTKYSNILLIKNDKNYGYAGGNNIGFSHATGKYIVALNNDMVVKPDWLDEPIKFLESDSTIGVVGCRQMRLDKKTIDGLFSYIENNLCVNSFGVNQLFENKFCEFKPGYVMSINGGSAIYRKNVIDKLGGFDECFFGYYEDSDLCMRIFVHGWKILYSPNSVVYHAGSASFKKNMYQYHYLLERNRLWFIYKNFPVKEIFNHSVSLIVYEIKFLLRAIIKLKNVKLYFSTRIDAIIGLKKFSKSRKFNIAEYRKNYDNLEKIIKNKIIPIE